MLEPLSKNLECYNVLLIGGRTLVSILNFYMHHSLETSSPHGA